MNRIFQFAALASLSAPAFALPLWNNVESDMTVAQVRALYPEGGSVQYRNDSTVIGDYRVTEGCQANVHIDHPRGVVTRVRVRGEGSMGGRCSDRVLTALSARYGEALSRDRRGGSFLAREGTVYVWNREGVTLRFKRYTNGVFGGGGLAAASWELEYSLVADDVAL